MQINKKIRANNKTVDEYIESLEQYILTFDASNIKKLILACDSVAGILADDIVLLPKLGDDEDETKLQMLGSKKNKHFMAYKNVIADIKHFKTISDLVEELKPKEHTEEKQTLTEAKKEEKKPKKNIQDFVFNNEA